MGYEESLGNSWKNYDKREWRKYERTVEIREKMTYKSREVSVSVVIIVEHDVVRVPPCEVRNIDQVGVLEVECSVDLCRANESQSRWDVMRIMKCSLILSIWFLKLLESVLNSHFL